ncbi:J domain-containing protein [Devosia ginsengisoli]|uniref:J domain-containing protein n=1 Tax=Devosia ginsengisoli TaxID=400770 RepID=UPI0026F36304|nr:J domain-containing protein [Devosia ginsengisoli]MCR6673292.1 J domain-containing protein [Devosia ginsengisoli]
MTPYPLAWPPGMPRSKNREAGQFRTTLTGAMNNVRDSLRRFAADSGKPIADLVISSNVTLGQEKPADPGVAIWFKWDGLSVSIPVDRYLSVAANLQAIHHIVEARRTELRHGTLSLVRATFTGFAALADHSGGNKRSWQAVLGLTETAYPDAPRVVTANTINEAYKRLAKTRHPDNGGSDEAMAELNAARAEALREIAR